MTKSKFSIFFSAALAIALVVAIVFAVSGHAKAVKYERQLNNNYQHAFSELVTAVDELDTALQKGLYATTPDLFSTLCTQAFGKAQIAQSALGELPYGNVELEQTAAFLAKTGDYAMALARSAHQNGGCTEEDRELLRSLSAAATTLSSTLQNLQAEMYNGRVTADDLETVQARLSAATESGGEILSESSFQTLEANFPEVPTLIYDGPFSDHIVNREPRMLEGESEIGIEEAQKIAAQFLGLQTNELSLMSEGGKPFATYGFSAPSSANSEYYIEVTQTGGMVLSVINSRLIQTPTLTQEEATSLATERLKAQGYENLAPSYFIEQAGVLTVNFAPVQNGAMCYPDLIEVAIALDNGELMGFETQGYLTNHYTRETTQPSVSREQAQSIVSSELTVLSHQVAIIPTDGQYEVLCHEFKCSRPDGRHVIVYVNGQSGLEEHILILLEDETGTLAL